MKLNSIFPFKFAVAVSAVLYCLFIVFHIGVIAGTIPDSIVWGGRLAGNPDLIKFEIISLSLQIIILCLTLIRGGYVKIPGLTAVSRYSMWLWATLFLFNTLGNLVAVTALEKYLFTPVTIILFLCTLRLALREDA